MSTYSITYWPPPPPTGQTYSPVTVTVTAAGFDSTDESMFFVDDARTVVFSVPTGLFPVVTRTAA